MEKINYLAHYDSLTDLPNRKFFTQKLKVALDEAMMNGKMVSVMFFDIDKFKYINDTYGHDIGDLVLKKISHRIKDIIGKNDTAARFGGDEFVLFQSNIRSVKEIEEMAEKILNEIRKPFIIKKRYIDVTISIGISIYPKHEKSIEELIKKADAAMYAVKNKSRNSYRIYE